MTLNITTLRNDTHYKDTLHNVVQYNIKIVTMSIAYNKNSYAECRYSGCRYAERRCAPEPHHGDAFVGVLLDEERLSKLVGVGDGPGGKVIKLFFLFLQPFYQNKLECSLKK